MSKFPVEDKVILASAGSGKTFALSDRIVKLLATGAKPEQIVALTFTRAAAAEFVARTLEKLAKAASSEEEAADLRSKDRLNLPSRRVLRLNNPQLPAATPTERPELWFSLTTDERPTSEPVPLVVGSATK